MNKKVSNLKLQQDNTPDWLSNGYEHIWLPYTQMQYGALPLPVNDAYNSTIILEDGTELIDSMSSWWTSCHGYKNENIIAAIQKQAKDLSHVMFGGLANEPAYRLATKLVEITPEGLNKVFYSDSGSTAVEVAMKMAVQFWKNNKKADKKKFISFRNSYHGDTMGAMSLADQEDWIHKTFKGYTPEQICCDLPTNDLELKKFKKLLEENHSILAGIFIEPLVQCAGGFRIHSPDILAAIYKLSKKYDLLFIADEVATGFGRTGTMFACEQADITPDIMCLGKALTGGYIPLAATLATNDVFNSFLGDNLESAFMHGPTFMGNPLACAAALASIEIFENEPRLEQVEQINIQLTEQLEQCRKLSAVKDVRTIGAIGVVELKQCDWDTLTFLRKEFVRQGTWIRPFDNVCYIMPPFIIKKEELSRLTEAIFAVLKGL